LKRVFADTAYWIALANPFDHHHSRALELSATLGRARLLTTDAVLTEFLNALSNAGPSVRRAAVETVERILRDPAVQVIPSGRQAFRRSLALYKARPDKGYSLTDCWSMVVMHDRRIAEALTTDRHFEQEGLVALMRNTLRR
jgi:predicted nucleic acid-binding protein